MRYSYAKQNQQNKVNKKYEDHVKCQYARISQFKIGTVKLTKRRST